MEKDILDLMVNVAQGNPGAARVLGEIYKHDQAVLVPLCIAMALTKSKGNALWLVYKDIYKFDIQKTASFLKHWFDNYVQPLEEYISDHELAPHYLKRNVVQQTPN